MPKMNFKLGYQRRTIEKELPTLETKAAQRARFVLFWDEGLARDVIAARVGLSVKTVWVWQTMIEDRFERDDPIDIREFIHSPRAPGRPARSKQRLMEELWKIPESGKPKSSAELAKQTGVPAGTIRRVLSSLKKGPKVEAVGKNG